MRRLEITYEKAERILIALLLIFFSIYLFFMKYRVVNKDIFIFFAILFLVIGIGILLYSLRDDIEFFFSKF